MMQVLRVALATAVFVAAIGAQPALAAPVDLVCPFAVTVNFAPGVTLTQQRVDITGSLAAGTSALPPVPCSSPLTGVPYTAATATLTASGTVACVFVGNGLSGAVNGTLAVTWNNGDHSTISFSIIPIGPVPVIVANVTSGALQGSTVTVLPGPTGLTGNCLLTPVTSLSFAGALSFLQL
jgi:hypothetical protein